MIIGTVQQKNLFNANDFNSAHNGQWYYFMYSDIRCPALKTLSFLATKIFLAATILQKATSGKLELEALKHDHLTISFVFLRWLRERVDFNKSSLFLTYM